MRLNSLKLKDFRNYKTFDRKFSKQAVILVGGNTVGKTNLLEAIRFLSLFKSFRTNLTRDMIAWENTVARVEGEFTESKVDKKIVGILAGGVQGVPVRRQIMVNNNKVSTRKAVGNFLTVLFSPDDVQLITGSPSRRRRYLDTVLGQLSRRYYQSLQNYNRALEQRNAILASEQFPSEELSIWNDQLAEEGGYLIKERSIFFEKINNPLTLTYKQISGQGNLRIHYQPCLSQPGVEQLLSARDVESILKKSLKKTEPYDFRYQSTSVGPHRDDFDFILDNRSLESHGSRGEWRSSVLALKIGEQNYIKEVTKKLPILLLDDVFSELDQSRRQALLRQIDGHQVFITTTEIRSLNRDFLRQAEIIKL
ncbi:DNA replication/repair protein RecF [Patescibacteria group bacterium]